MAALENLVTDAVLGQEGPARTAIPPRHDAGEAVRLHGTSAGSAAALSAVGHQLPARYAHAILAYRFGDMRSALTQIEGLIQAHAEQPLFLRAQGPGVARKRPRRRSDPAVAPRRGACPRSRAHSDTAGAGHDRHQKPQDGRSEAIPLLRAALVKEPESGDAYEQLAMAYGHNGNLAEADLASAQAAFARGDSKTARELAGRAKTAFSRRLAGMGKSRRHRGFQQRQEPTAIRSITAKER